jgi:hypothetical protein
MTFFVREFLQLLLVSCVVLALVVLVRDLIPRWRKLRANIELRARKEERTTVSGLPELEGELD